MCFRLPGGHNLYKAMLTTLGTSEINFLDTLYNAFISINQYQSKQSFLSDVMEDYSRISILFTP